MFGLSSRINSDFHELRSNFRYDIRAAVLVALIALPFSLGIAIASGAPPISGIISSIVAGFIFPLFKGANVAISGPAAGLAPAILAAVHDLGSFHYVGVAIVLTGMIQFALYKLKAAKLSAMFPQAAIHGMMALIGLMITFKELPHLIGNDFKAEKHALEEQGLEARAIDFIGWTRDALWSGQYDSHSLIIGISCLAMVFALGWITKAKQGHGSDEESVPESVRMRLLKLLPVQLVVVLFGIILGQIIGVSEKHVISVPPLNEGISPPDFYGVFGLPALWLKVVKWALILTFIDGVESLATASAVDRIDPLRRRSDPNKVLRAMAWSNMISGLLGGLTIIPGGVKSTACVNAGGRTLWTNLYIALLLIFFVLIGTQLLNLIPFSALAAVLIYTGFVLYAPAKWIHSYKLGPEQLLVFTATAVVGLWKNDLLYGILAGIGLKLIILALLITWNTLREWKIRQGKIAFARELFKRLAGIVLSPVGESKFLPGGAYLLRFHRPVVCLNAPWLLAALDTIPKEAKRVIVSMMPLDGCMIIDHTSRLMLREFEERCTTEGIQVDRYGEEALQALWSAETFKSDLGLLFCPSYLLPQLALAPAYAFLTESTEGGPSVLEEEETHRQNPNDSATLAFD